MDEESRQQLMAEARLEHAREQLRTARGNLPFGIVLLVLAGIATTATLLPPGPIIMPIIAGVGLLLVPAGLAILIRSAVTIARSRRQLRDAEIPTARLVR